MNEALCELHMQCAFLHIIHTLCNSNLSMTFIQTIRAMTCYVNGTSSNMKIQPFYVLKELLYILYKHCTSFHITQCVE